MSRFSSNKAIKQLDLRTRPTMDNRCSAKLQEPSVRVPRHFQKIHLKVRNDGKMAVQVTIEEKTESRNDTIGNMMAFFRDKIRCPETTMETFTVNLVNGPDESQNEFMDAFIEQTASLPHRIFTESCSIYNCNGGDDRLARILGTMRPRILRTIRLYVHDADGRKISLEKVSRLDQWKMAKELDAWYSQDIVWNFSMFGHFEDLQMCVHSGLDVEAILELLDFHTNATACTPPSIRIGCVIDSDELVARSGIVAKERKLIRPGLFFTHCHRSIHFYNKNYRDF